MNSTVFAVDLTIFIAKVVDCRHEKITVFGVVGKHPNAKLVFDDDVKNTLSKDFAGNIWICKGYLFGFVINEQLPKNSRLEQSDFGVVPLSYHIGIGAGRWILVEGCLG